MPNTLNQRQRLFKKVVVNNNLEYDFIGNKDVEFTDSAPGSFIVTSPYENRIDLISYKVYGTVELWWLICMQNRIMDPFSEITVGVVLEIPSISTYYDFFNRNIKAPDKIPGIFQRRTP